MEGKMDKNINQDELMNSIFQYREPLKKNPEMQINQYHALDQGSSAATIRDGTTKQDEYSNLVQQMLYFIQTSLNCV